MKEYLELYDEQNQALNQQLPRREVHAAGLWHRTSQIYVLNPQQKVLCNLRHPGKDLFPAMWDVSIGGHLSPGETYRDCALRELAEELGIVVDPERLNFLTTRQINLTDEASKLQDREHAGIFLYRTELGLPDFNFQREEISELRYLSVAKIKANLTAEKPEIPFIPLQKFYLENLDLICSLIS